MILSEPPHSAYDLRFRLLGVPVRIHPMFWLMTLFMAGFNSPVRVVVMWMLSVLVSITIHELGHVFAYRRFGVDAYVVLYSFGGLAVPTGRADYGWSSAARIAPWQRAIVSFAGPAVQMASAFLLLGGLYFGGARVGFPFTGLLKYLPAAYVESSDFLTLFANDYFYISIFWALVNLLPILPLDGGRISEVMFEAADPRTGSRQALYVSMITAGLTGALMYVEFKSLFSVFFFGYLAYMNYQTLNFISSNGRRW